MPRSQKHIYFEGLYEKEVLGVFTIIRGFANLQDLAKVSVPYTITDPNSSGVVDGHQRQIDESHAAEIKSYLEKSDARFFPEIILSIRTRFEEERWGGQEQIGIWSGGLDGILIKRKFISRSMRMQQIWIDLNKLDEIKSNKVIRRIDGNHRLSHAEQLVIDRHSPSKYLAPFCMIILGPPEKVEDDYAESKIFHIINSKALRLDSEHALKLLLGQRSEYSMSPEQEFEYDPVLHLTRLLRDKINGLSQEHKQRLGNHPLTCFNNTANALIAFKGDIKKERRVMQSYADGLFAAITEFITRLWHDLPNLCKAEYFIELSARVWTKFEDIQDNSQRINKAVEYLEKLGNWLGEGGFSNIKDEESFAQQLLAVYESARSKIPKKVFLARWYPDEIEDAEDKRKAALRLEQIRHTLEKIKTDHDIELELIDLGTEEGGTGPIHQKMYEAIESSDIVLIDLTGQRPNVYTEAGFALKHHEQGKLLFLFNPKDENDKVPFDLNTYRYEAISEAAEIPDKLLPHIKAILKQSGADID